MKAEVSDGVFEAIHDFGVAEQVGFAGEIDVDELASTAYHAEFYTRETETDAWQPMGGIACDAVDTRATVRFTRSRYVKVVATVSGSELPAGTVGY